MWNEKTKQTAIIAIGTVESGRRYDAINYNDPITLGVGQWFGTRAAGLLKRMKDAHPNEWAIVADSVKKDVDTHGVSDRFWVSRYLTQGEGETIKPLLTASKEVQDALIVDDVEGYASTIRQYGFDVDKNTDTFILWATAYHQSPRSALQVLAQTGNDVALDGMLSAILNHRVLGHYKNRYNTVAKIVREKQTDSSITLSSDDSGGDISSVDNQISGIISYVRLDGDGCLRISTKNGVVTAYPTQVNYWHVGAKDGGTVGSSELVTDTSSTPPNSGGDVDSKRQKVVQWAKDRIKKFAYAQAPGRMDPDKNGFTDCSGLTYRAYLDVVGIDIGHSTFEQKDTGTEIARGGGVMPDDDVAKLLPGDLVVMMWNAGYQHVEMIESGAKHIGHGGPGMGPTEGNNIATYVRNTRWWTVRRYL